MCHRSAFTFIESNLSDSRLMPLCAAAAALPTFPPSDASCSSSACRPSAPSCGPSTSSAPRRVPTASPAASLPPYASLLPACVRFAIRSALASGSGLAALAVLLHRVRNPRSKAKDPTHPASSFPAALPYTPPDSPEGDVSLGCVPLAAGTDSRYFFLLPPFFG